MIVSSTTTRYYHHYYDHEYQILPQEKKKNLGFMILRSSNRNNIDDQGDNDDHNNIITTTIRSDSSSSTSGIKSPILVTSTFIDDFIDNMTWKDYEVLNKAINPLIMIPIISPILAYLSYDELATLFNSLFDLLDFKRSWVPVDGGAYKASIIAPAINGIVVPSVSILFATLISNTVATLRQRQIDIHTCLNTEAGDLRVLSSLVDAFPKSEEKDRCREYLTQYTSRLIAESRDDTKLNVLDFQGSTDSEMNGFVTVLNQLVASSSSSSSSTTTATSSTTIINGNDSNSRDNDDDKKKTKKKQQKQQPNGSILSESYGAVIRLNSQRSARITALQSTFPTLHYAILSALAASICLAFLIETDQQLLIFLNAIQLRVLWTMLIGTFSALAVVCYDLSGPFRGQYQISNAVYQLMTIRDALRVASAEDENH
jgi:hypothetical protein